MLEQMMAFDPTALTKIDELLRFLAVVVLCAGVLYFVFRHIAADEADGVEFASTIFVLTVAIGLLVLIIKQAPAVSFGLFGAMSIMRFRSQTIQPRRMIFIFMAAAIGVCCGAGQYMTTIFGTSVLSILTLALFGKFGEAAKRARPIAPAEEAKAPEAAADHRWGLDLVTGEMPDGQRLRVLAVVDEKTQWVLALVADPNLSGTRIAGELERLVGEHSAPTTLVSDTWPEFGSKQVKDWKKSKSITWDWLEPQSGSDALITAISRRVRDECLGGGRVASLADARSRLDAWRQAHNAHIDAARMEPPKATEIEAVKSPTPAAPLAPVVKPVPVLAPASNGSKPAVAPQATHPAFLLRPAYPASGTAPLPTPAPGSQKQGNRPALAPPRSASRKTS